MTTTITGKLNKEPKFHASGEGAVIAFSIGKKEYDRKTKAEVWANYSVGVFAKGNQLQYYTDRIKQGSIVTVAGSGIIPEQYNDTVFLKLQNPRIDYIGQSAAPDPQQGYQQQAPQQQAPAPQPASSFDDFDDDIPF